MVVEVGSVRLTVYLLYLILHPQNNIIAIHFFVVIIGNGDVSYEVIYGVIMRKFRASMEFF